MGYVTIYNEDETRSKQEQSCCKWVDAFRPYVEVGAGSPKYLVVGVTVNEDEITKRAALLEEAKTLWQSYEQGGEFPHGKSRELLALEEQIRQRLAEMPEALRQSRALVSADIDKEFTRVLDYLTADTGWKTDTTHTALRYRNTRFMTTHVAAKGADGKVFLHAVHLASDRQTDGSWGSLYGHIMWSDWMAEKNVNEDPPSP